MFRENSEPAPIEKTSSIVRPLSRSIAMAELQALGYTSDSPNWRGLLRLIEKGYIQTKNLQRQQ